MKEQTENRRIRMTKRLMRDAMLELLEQSELSGISVTAVCQAADVNRSTFYNYYSCPSDLLREIEQDVLDRIPVPPPVLDREGEDELLRSTTGFFDYVKENERVFRVLFSESPNDDFSSRLVDLLCSQLIPGIDNVVILVCRDGRNFRSELPITVDSRNVALKSEVNAIYGRNVVQ